MRTCDRTGCDREGKWTPVALLVPVGKPETKPAEFLFGVVECDDHRETAVIGDLIAEHGWEFLDRAFSALYDALPDHSTVGLVHRPVAVTDAIFDRG